MDIRILSPVDRDSRKGNGVTVRRWQRILGDLGHTVTVDTDPSLSGPPDCLIALHARRSADAIRRFRRNYPEVPIILALTGTDVCRDIHEKELARGSLDVADHLVVLQEKALDELSADQRGKAHVIHQSIRSVPWSSNSPSELNNDGFNVVVLAHLRSVKDPFRAAEAVRGLPESSSIRVWHLGEELEGGYAAQANSLSEKLNRYQWLGGRPRREARLFLSHADLMVISSELEGGAHVVSEAIACETPVLASDIPGNVGLLGDDYDGYFEVGNDDELADLLRKAEENDGFYHQLLNKVGKQGYTIDPAREYDCWQKLIDKF